ncbi:MAG: general secretion pathway protein GspB [Candidatus Omnitrophica bacterium]|nr:general secretion pathway protein GspB [Candidatus Omnitrophota bacterium]
MSIINEALKKAQTEKGSPALRGPVAPVQLIGREMEYERKKSKVNWGPVFILSVLLLITAPLIAPIFSTPFRNEARLFSYETMPGDSRKAQFAVEEAPRQMAPPAPVARPLFDAAGALRPALHLDGIVFSPNDQSYCLINGKILKSGDKIQGAELVRIAPQQVTLSYQGEKFVLAPEPAN